MPGVSDAVLTFINGELTHPAADGSIDFPLNAMIETYMLEPTGEAGEEGSKAYFLVGLEQQEWVERLALRASVSSRRSSRVFADSSPS